jgi:uncharacterized protein
VKRVLRACFLTILCAALLVAQRSDAQDYPAYTDVYINDFGQLLSRREEDTIRKRLIRLYNDTGVEVVVVTMNSMTSYGHDGKIEPFATGLFNHWGVGNADRNNGVMVLVARNDRQMRIELGAGYDRAMDARMQRIINREMLPEFRKNRYEKGIRQGVDALIDDLRQYSGAELGFWEGLYDRVDRAGDGIKLLIGAFLTWVGGWLGLTSFRAWRRRRPRYCPLDSERMVKLSEDWEDKHLQSGQIKEESLGSVQYDVWDCPVCDHLTVEGYTRSLSRFGACRACGYKTMEGTTMVLSHATKSNEGAKRIDYHCHHCGDRYAAHHVIPRKGESGSDSDHSSFGGGSSSGGGASGSW